MKKLIYTKDMETREWLHYRRLGIGGSDASTILGINPYHSILRLWEEKTGRIPVEEKENEYTHFGHVMEPVIRKEFERRTENRVRRSNFILQEKYSRAVLSSIELPQTAETLAEQYEQVETEMKKLQKEKNALSNQLKNLMKENETGHAGRYTVTWKNVQKRSLDTGRVKKELGEEYEKYLVDSSYRKFSVA